MFINIEVRFVHNIIYDLNDLILLHNIYDFVIVMVIIFTYKYVCDYILQLYNT